MMRRASAVGVAAIAVWASGAQAQTIFGDTRLSYQNGVVYDDDLVPGRRVNQPFLVEEQAGGGVGDPAAFAPFGAADRLSASGRPVPAPSPNLIGPDGRAVGAVRRSIEEARRRNELLGFGD